MNPMHGSKLSCHSNSIQRGDWDPGEENWGESGEPIEAWAKAVD
jgi:hypothetical protein